MKQYGKNLEILGKIYPDARIGLVVPDYVDIHSIDQLNANKEKFGGEIIGIDAAQDYACCRYGHRKIQSGLQIAGV